MTTALDDVKGVRDIFSPLEEKMPNELDKELLRTYFSNQDGIDLTGFSRVNEGYHLAITSNKRDRGYYFFGELQLDRNHEARMEVELARQKRLGKIINRKFIDYTEGLSGFSWSKN